MNFLLKIFDPDLQKLSELEQALGHFRSVMFQPVETMRYLKPPGGIDVLYLPLFAAEQFGARPLIHKSQILSTSSAKQEDGLPAFIVTGTCLAKDDPRGPIPEMRLLLSAVFEAVRSFNMSQTAKLETIGFWAYDLSRGITPGELSGVLASVVPGFR